MKKLVYSLFALVGLFCTSSCVEQQTNYVEGTPVLSVSTELFVADGEDQVVLTVMVGDVDVTDDAKLRRSLARYLRLLVPRTTSSLPATMARCPIRLW